MRVLTREFLLYFDGSKLKFVWKVIFWPVRNYMTEPVNTTSHYSKIISRPRAGLFLLIYIFLTLEQIDLENGTFHILAIDKAKRAWQLQTCQTTKGTANNWLDKCKKLFLLPVSATPRSNLVTKTTPHKHKTRHFRCHSCLIKRLNYVLKHRAFKIYNVGQHPFRNGSFYR